MIIKWKQDGPDYYFKYQGLTFTSYWTINGWQAIIQDNKRNDYKTLYRKMFKTEKGCKKHLILRVDVINGGWSK